MGPENNNVGSIANNEAGAGFLAKRPASVGMQRFLAKKGIGSTEELNEMTRRYAPRLRWRRPL